MVVEPDGGTPRRVELRAGTNHVGRGLENDVVLSDPSLSRRHARLDLEGAQATLTDLDSRNGCFLDGLRVRQCRLRSGDRVRCGDVTLQFESDAPGPPAAGPVLEGLVTAAVSGESALRLAPGGRAEVKLRVLLRVAQALSAPRPSERLLETAFDLLFEVFDAHRAALLLAAPDGALRPALARARRGPPGLTCSASIAEQVRATRSGLLVADARADARFEAARSVLRESIRAAMCVPLLAAERFLGVLYVDHLETPGRFGSEDLEFLSAFAAQIALALENARLFARLEEEAVRRASLARFFPPAVLRAALEQPDFGASPRDLEVTVLFADLSGFTALSSRTPPREVVALLNGYFPRMAAVVFRHGGTLEKYIGDALMAIWGAPEPSPDDADRAVAAALEMGAELRRWNGERGGEPLELHVGLNSGPVAFGNIGSPDYVQFAAIGDTTNVASRICSVAGPGEVVVSEATRLRLARPPVLQPLPPAAVKGKSEALVLYRVGG